MLMITNNSSLFDPFFTTGDYPHREHVIKPWAGANRLESWDVIASWDEYSREA